MPQARLIALYHRGWYLARNSSSSSPSARCGGVSASAGGRNRSSSLSHGQQHGGAHPWRLLGASSGASAYRGLVLAGLQALHEGLHGAASWGAPAFPAWPLEHRPCMATLLRSNATGAAGRRGGNASATTEPWSKKGGVAFPLMRTVAKPSSNLKPTSTTAPPALPAPPRRAAASAAAPVSRHASSGKALAAMAVPVHVPSCQVRGGAAFTTDSL